MPPADIPVPETWPASLQAMARGGFDPSSPAWVEAEITAFRDGPWHAALMFRIAHWLFMLVMSLFSFGWLILGMMFAGGLLWRLQFFAPEQRILRFRVLVIGLKAGLAFEAAAGTLFWTAPTVNHWTWAAGHILQQTALFFLPFGHLAGVACLAGRLPAWLREPVARTGRLSLTVYLLETVLATALSYHWGAGLFGRVAPVEQLLLAAGIWTVLVAFSHLWLAWFPTGPQEAIWRRLAYGRSGERTVTGMDGCAAGSAR